MIRFPVVIFTLLMLLAPAQAALISFDISGTARSGSSDYGIAGGDALNGTLTIEDSVSQGKGRSRDVGSFEFRVGNTVFDMDGGHFSASYRLRADALRKLTVAAKPQEFRRDRRQFLFNLSPQRTTLKIKDLGNDWIHVDNIVIERTGLYPPFGGFEADHSPVAEPASLLVFAGALGMVSLLGRRRRSA